MADLIPFHTSETATIKSVALWDTLVFEELLERVLDAGSDSHEFFGGKFTGGYWLQQRPKEFAALVRFLQLYAPFNYYMEIGAASGGNLRFMNENVEIRHCISIDLHDHARTFMQDKNFQGITHKLLQFIGSSHTPEAKVFLERALDRHMLDCVFIDGDHRAEGLRQDIDLVRPFTTRRSFLIFHDTHSITDVGDVLYEKLERREMELLAHFFDPEKPFGIAVTRFL